MIPVIDHRTVLVTRVEGGGQVTLPYREALRIMNLTEAKCYQLIANGNVICTETYGAVVLDWGF